eukprot:12397802-Karenia_brevis.AAC.1
MPVPVRSRWRPLVGSQLFQTAPARFPPQHGCGPLLARFPLGSCRILLGSRPILARVPRFLLARFLPDLVGSLCFPSLLALFDRLLPAPAGPKAHRSRLIPARLL